MASFRTNYGVVVTIDFLEETVDIKSEDVKAPGITQEHIILSNGKSRVLIHRKGNKPVNYKQLSFLPQELIPPILRLIKVPTTKKEDIEFLVDLERFIYSLFGNRSSAIFFKILAPEGLFEGFPICVVSPSSILCYLLEDQGVNEEGEFDKISLFRQDKLSTYRFLNDLLDPAFDVFVEKKSLAKGYKRTTQADEWQHKDDKSCEWERYLHYLGNKDFPNLSISLLNGKSYKIIDSLSVYTNTVCFKVSVLEEKEKLRDFINKYENCFLFVSLISDTCVEVIMNFSQLPPINLLEIREFNYFGNKETLSKAKREFIKASYVKEVLKVYYVDKYGVQENKWSEVLNLSDEVRERLVVPQNQNYDISIFGKLWKGVDELKKEVEKFKNKKEETRYDDILKKDLEYLKESEQHVINVSRYMFNCFKGIWDANLELFYRRIIGDYSLLDESSIKSKLAETVGLVGPNLDENNPRFLLNGGKIIANGKA